MSGFEIKGSVYLDKNFSWKQLFWGGVLCMKIAGLFVLPDKICLIWRHFSHQKEVVKTPKRQEIYTKFTIQAHSNFDKFVQMSHTKTEFAFFVHKTRPKTKELFPRKVLISEDGTLIPLGHLVSNLALIYIGSYYITYLLKWN